MSHRFPSTLIFMMLMCLLINGSLTESHIAEFDMRADLDGAETEDKVMLRDPRPAEELFTPLKRGIDACSCCASKHLLFCCSNCMKQRTSTSPDVAQRSRLPSRNLANLKNKYCDCCRRGPLRDRATGGKCCQRCYLLESIML